MSWKDIEMILTQILREISENLDGTADGWRQNC